MEAEDVFASLAIPLMKLVGLKTMELATEGRFTSFIIQTDSDSGSQPQSFGSGSGPSGRSDRNRQRAKIYREESLPKCKPNKRCDSASDSSHYWNIIALLLLLPFTYFLEKKDRPPLNIYLVLQFFLLGLVGVTCNQEFYFLGLENTSPTFVSAVEYAVPAVTFLMAALFRIEQVHLNRKDGKAKVFGVLASVAGASVITLYKGPSIYGPPSPLPLSQSHTLLSLFGDAKENWTLGCIYVVGHCVCWSSWIVLQGSVLKKYPARLSVTSFTLFFGILQLSAIAVYVERDPQEWHIHFSSELLAILYAGVVASAMHYAIQLWAIDKGGPMLVSVYLSLQTLLVAIMESFILSAELYLGSIVGAVLIIAGLYLVVCGKSKGSKFGKEIKSETSPAPLNIDNQIKHYSEEDDSSVVQPLLSSSSKWFSKCIVFC